MTLKEILSLMRTCMVSSLHQKGEMAVPEISTFVQLTL
jgi:hypothetical protein